MEKRIAGKIAGYEYEPKDSIVNYSMPHKYTPDFVPDNCKDVLIEVKGYFKTSSEASKYVSIKRDNPDKEIIFIFSNPIKKAHPSCKVRRDGTIMTLAEWAIKHEFLFYAEADLPKEITSGRITEQWINKERNKRNYNVNSG